MEEKERPKLLEGLKKLEGARKMGGLKMLEGQTILPVPSPCLHQTSGD